MPTYDHVVIFGDSLSDIGQKWNQPMGGVGARMSDGALRELNVNSTGRFSDCKNWTDYMFEAATGGSLIGSTAAATIRTSKAFHSLSSRWITPPGGARFRYANYAVGGAVGAHKAAVKLKAGLTTFQDQIDAFKKDIGLLPKAGGHSFLVIVMFGANDIYTDEKSPAEAPRIATTIIKRCDKVQAILNNAFSGVEKMLVIAGVGMPTQSHFYAVQKLDLEREEGRCLSKLHAVKDRTRLTSLRSAWVEASNKRWEYMDKIGKLQQSAGVLNQALWKYCEGQPNAIYFPMRETLAVLAEQSASLGIANNTNQSNTVHTMIHYREGNTFIADPHDERLRLADGRTPLFTPDGKHPTSRGYEFLWHRMRAMFSEKDIGFGLLAPQEGGPSTLNKSLHAAENEAMQRELVQAVADYKRETKSVFARSSDESKAALAWLEARFRQGDVRFTNPRTIGRPWPHVEVPWFVAAMYLLSGKTAHDGPPRPDEAPEPLKSLNGRLALKVKNAVKSWVSVNHRYAGYAE
jgi:chorismate mutase